MSYDFLTRFKLPDNEAAIDQVVRGNGDYHLLRQAPWTTRAQVLATGICHNNLKTLIKDGREVNRNRGITAIGGHPSLAEGPKGPSPQLNDDWRKIFYPSAGQLRDLPSGSCLIILDLKLLRPFHSSDDRQFYPADNPLKRDWVFHVPYFAASSIKGLLRWAWRMCHQDAASQAETELFGPRPDDLDEEHARQGCLYTYPVFWEQCSTGQEILNPQDRQQCAGTVPVKYEIIRDGATGSLNLLFVNRNQDTVGNPSAIAKLLEALNYLVTSSGLSAKRNVDWGSVKVKKWQAATMNPAPKREELPVFEEETETQDPWTDFCDEDGNLLDFTSPVYTAKNIATLLGINVKRCRGKKHRKPALEKVKQRWDERNNLQEQEVEQPTKTDEEELLPEVITAASFEQWLDKLGRAGIVEEQS